MDSAFILIEMRRNMIYRSGDSDSSFFIGFTNFSLIPFNTFFPSPGGHNSCLHLFLWAGASPSSVLSS